VKNFMLLTVVLVLSALALAQQVPQKVQIGDANTATTTCDVTFSSGTSTNATKFCVTANGNIAQFSVAGGEMIAVGGVGEGYGICDQTSGVAYFDYADGASTNWMAPSSFTHSGNVVTILRETSDGLWQLKQTITNVPANASGPGSAKIAMVLKNLSSTTRTAFIMRYADVDADGDATGNDFDFTAQTAFGLEPHSNRGLSSTNNTFNLNLGQDTFTQDLQSGPTPCDPFALRAPQPFHGDGSIVQFWSLTANKNASVSVVSTYKPI
jgi:hypothetical protein